MAKRRAKKKAAKRKPAKRAAKRKPAKRVVKRKAKKAPAKRARKVSAPAIRRVRTVAPSSSTDNRWNVVGVIVNLFFPGLGTVIFGQVNKGVIQIILTLISIPLIMSVFFTLPGLVLYIANWIWALITSIKQVQA